MSAGFRSAFALVLLVALCAQLAIGDVGASAAATTPAVAAAPAAPSAATAPPPPELGLVRWGRDVDTALARARAESRHVLVLFDEVPGCATCVGFGQSALSHLLLVEAIETEFIPVAIYNNVPGQDAAILARFDEPAWNNPVVRFLDADGRDIVPRREGVWTAHALAMRIAQALHAAGRRAPDYLVLAAEETAEAARETATFGMSCYWDGEVCLGALDGVLATRTGTIDGHEVVEVEFDAEARSYAEIVRAAIDAGCAEIAYARDAAQEAVARRIVGDRARRAAAPAGDAPEPDRKFYLRADPLRWAPLTPLQAARANAALARGRDPLVTLSPRQRALAARVTEAVARDPDALAGLSSPERVESLPGYELALCARLDALSASRASRLDRRRAPR